MEISQRETLIYECYIPFLTTFKTSPVHSELVRSSHFNQPANKLPKKNFKLESQFARYWDIVAGLWTFDTHNQLLCNNVHCNKNLHLICSLLV